MSEKDDELLEAVKAAYDPTCNFDGDILEYVLYEVQYAKEGDRAAKRRWAKRLIQEIYSV